jgi:transposase
VAVRLAGEQVNCFLFCFRMSFSGKAVHRISLSGGQEAFFEGHEHAFGVLGGVPAGKVRYDNLKSAVASVLGFTRARVETERWTAFRSHYDFSELAHSGQCQRSRRVSCRPADAVTAHGGCSRASIQATS